jgi:hypothetical protein
MPSAQHEAPLELIRQCPTVAAELVQAITGSDDDGLPPGKFKVSLGPTDLSDVVPVTFLADSVVRDTGAADAARRTFEARMIATEWMAHPFVEKFKKKASKKAARQASPRPKQRTSSSSSTPTASR